MIEEREARSRCMYSTLSSVKLNADTPLWLDPVSDIASSFCPGTYRITLSNSSDFFFTQHTLSFDVIFIFIFNYVVLLFFFTLNCCCFQGAPQQR